MSKKTVLGEDAGIYQKNRPVHEREKLKGLPLRKKIGYIKDYYLKAVLALGCTAALVIYVLFILFGPKDEVVLRAIAINDTYTEDNKQALINDYGKTINYKPSKEDIKIDDDFIVDPSNTSSPVFSKILVYTTAGTVDIMIADQKIFTYYAKNGFLLDLTEVLTQDELTALKDKILYEKRNPVDDDDYSPNEERLDPNKEYAFGVCLDDSSTYKKYSTSYAEQKKSGEKESYYVGIIPNTSQKENAVAFIKYLLDK